MEGSNGAATTPSSNPDGTSVTDPTLSDEAPLSHRQALLWPKWQIQMPVPRPALRRRFLMECWKPIHATIPQVRGVSVRMHSPGVQTGLVRCTRMLRIRTLSLFSDSALCAHVPTCVLNRCCLLKCFCILSTSCDICIALAMYDTYMYIYIFYFIV